MKKLFFIISLIIFCCGFTGKYTLEETEGKFNENIEFSFNYDLKKEAEKYIGIEDGEFFEPSILNDDIYALQNEKLYEKKIEVNSINSFVKLSNTYNIEELSKAKYLSICFDNFNAFKENNNFYIRISGTFMCQGRNITEINIKTDKKVEGNYYNQEENIYKWKIEDKNNRIEINIIEENIYINFIIIGMAILLGVIIIVVLIKSKNNNKI